MRRAPAAALVFVAAFVTLAFLFVPVLAIFVHVPPGRLVAQLSSPVVTVALVSSPLYVRQAIATFEAVDANLVAASRTLGAGPAKTFFRVVLPLARGRGEFGATIMFAGSLQGVTQTLPLAIYAQFDVNFDVALATSALLVLVSAALLVSLNVTPRWQPS